MTARTGKFVLWIALTGLLPAAESYAVSGFSFEADLTQPDLRWLQDLPRAVNQPFRMLNKKRHDATGGQQVLMLLRDSGMHPYIEARIQERRKSLLANPLGRSTSIDFWLGGIKIRGFSVSTASDSSLNLITNGNLPAIDQDQANLALQDLGSWPELGTSLEVALGNLMPGNPEMQDQASKSVNGEKVFFAAGDQLIPAWNFEIKIKGLPYEVISNEREILAFNPRYFDATDASANVYKTNKSDGTLEDVWFEINSGQNNLTNSYLTTDLAYSGQSRATASSDKKFNFPTNSHQFREANVFAHAASHVDFLIANGYQWGGSSAITLRVAECYESSCNCQAGQACGNKSNAVYVPWDDAYDGPAIRVGEGDGVLLKDLHFDSGVVNHEFGHHIVFSAITSYGKGTEALQLHEGLADFFAMMHANNPCLGSGICPVSQSSICYVQQECLRSAENDLFYGSMEFRSLPDHQKGQLISGFLWDLKVAGMTRSDLVRITLGAIDLLPATAAFGDFVDALTTAEENLTAGTHKELIQQKLLARGLDEATRSAADLSGGGKTTASSRKSGSSNIFGCTMQAMANTSQPLGPLSPTEGTVSALDDRAGHPLKMAIFVHDSPGLATTKNQPFKFDIFLWLLLAVPIIAGIRVIKLPRNRDRRQAQ